MSYSTVLKNYYFSNILNVCIIYKLWEKFFTHEGKKPPWMSEAFFGYCWLY